MVDEMDDAIRLVALDFDMTLIDHTSEGARLPAETIDALARLLARGVDVGVVSGRYVWEMQEILASLGVKWGDPFPSFYVTRETFIYRQEAADGMQPDREWNDRFARETSAFMKRLSGCAAGLIDHLASHGLQAGKWVLYSDYAFEIHLTDEESAAVACRLLTEALGVQGMEASVHRNRSVANVLHPQTNKGNTLLRLSRTLGLKPEQVLAIGDSLNDLSMLDGRFGFRGGAVGNAAPRVKEIVQEAGGGGYVAQARAGWGVAEIIREYERKGFL